MISLFVVSFYHELIELYKVALMSHKCVCKADFYFKKVDIYDEGHELFLVSVSWVLFIGVSECQVADWEALVTTTL